MKRIGLVGGTGPESTKEYYMGLIRKCSCFDYPEIVIFSVNMSEIIALQEEGGWDAAGGKLIEVIGHLEAAGVDFGAICANTPHIIFDHVQAAVNIPLVSIVDATVEAGKKAGIKKPLLLGTAWVMKSDMYPEAFAKEGIEVVAPVKKDLARIHRSIFNELEKGIIKQKTKQMYLDLIARFKDEQGCDSVILGCTEIPLLITRDDLDIPTLDTTRIHVDAIYEYAEDGK